MEAPSIPAGHETSQPAARPAPPIRPAAASPRIWAVGGGKGGVGKSVVTSSLAIALSNGGPRCALVDADLGGANLHTLLGVPRPDRTLSDFLTGRVKELSDVLTPTAIPGLSLVSGARAVLEMANPKHSQKQRLLRHLRRLDVAHVFVDLGAGASFNVLDPFLAADERIMVVVPEPTAIENAYHFLKAAFFRSLREVALGEHRDVLREVMEVARLDGLSPREMFELASRRSAETGRALRQLAREFAPRLIVNQADTGEHRRIGHEMVAAARRHLGASLHFVGALDLDAAVPAAVARQQPVMQLFPGSAFAKSVHETLERMRLGESLGPDRAPPRWCVDPATPPVATHGIAPGEVPLPRLRMRVRPRMRAPLPATDFEQPGASLRRCREHQGLSIRDLEERTRIRSRYLEAIEAERYAELPRDPYLESHVRAYAEVLGVLDARELAARYAQAARIARTEIARPRGLWARLRRDPRDPRDPKIDVLARRAES
jgi:flagellar biosynthesis protein FlhG